MDDIIRNEALALADDRQVRAMLDEVCRVTGMGFAAVARVTEDRWIACQVEDRIEFGLEAGGELQIATTICSDIRQTGQQVVIEDADWEEGWRTHPTPILYGFKSYVSLPIVLSDGSFFGTLCAIDPEPRELRAGQVVSMMQGFATRIAGIVEGPARPD